MLSIIRIITRFITSHRVYNFENKIFHYYQIVKTKLPIKHKKIIQNVNDKNSGEVLIA